MRHKRFYQFQKNWKSYLLGTPDISCEESLRSIETVAEFWSGYERPAPETKGSDLPLPVLLYAGVRALAMAYCTPDSRYYERPAVLEYLLERLDGLYQLYYNPGTDSPDWWALEIGIPMRLLDTLILLYDVLPNRDTLITKYTEPVLCFRDAYLISSRGKTETASNLIWKCHNLLLTAVLRQDDELLKWVQESLPRSLASGSEMKVPGMGSMYDDGFYPDGSFIQHYVFAYNGGYGKHLLICLSGLLYADRDIGLLAFPEAERARLGELVCNAYEPLIYNGRFLDLARGREPSRYNLEDKITGRLVMRALCYLQAALPAADRIRVRAMLKEWMLHSSNEILQDENPLSEYWLQASVVPLVQDILRDTVPARGPLILHKNYGVTAKSVHLTARWGLGISMYSKRIACYEHLNGESKNFWHISDGATYLYTTDADQYNGDFYATADMQRLPGTTVDRDDARMDAGYYNWFMPDSKNVYDWSGGCTVDDVNGIAGIRYRGQGTGLTRSLEARKSWFMFDKEVVALGSGISSDTGHEIDTTVDNHRLLPDGSNLLCLDGKETGSCKEPGSRYAEGHLAESVHLTGNCGTGSDMGYVFPGTANIHILCEQRNGSWRQINDGNPDTPCTNSFATLWFDHGTSPKDASYAYILLPGATAEQTSVYAASPEVEILENSLSAHAVRKADDGLICVNFWKSESYTCAGITSDKAASIMLHTAENGAELAVTDPANNDAVLTLTLPQLPGTLQPDKRVTVCQTDPLTIAVDTTGMMGAPVHIIFK